MNIFKINSKTHFIKDLIRFIDSYKEDFSRLKILLPNGTTCTHLQNSLIQTYGTIILPKIMPISELAAEEEEIFKIPSRQIGAITSLEEKLALAEIIRSYNALDYNLSQSLRLSPALAKLFFEFETNNLKFKDIKQLPKLDESEHWNIIYNFLSYAQEEWRKNINNMGKSTKATYQYLIFEAEINRLRNHPEESLIIAGTVGTNNTTNNFIKKALELKNVNFILPPFNQNAIQTKLSPENPLYRIQKFINTLDKNAKITSLGKEESNIFEKLIYKSNATKYENNIEFIELENTFIEAQYISIKCKNYLIDNPNSKIAIIVQSQDFKDQLTLFLDKNNVNYKDLFGKDLLSHPGISLLMLVSELIYSKFTLQNFFSLLSHPVISDNLTSEIKQIIRERNRLATNIEQISITLKEFASKEVLDKFVEIENIITTQSYENNFHSMMEEALKITEKLFPQIWTRYSDINPPLSEIFNKKWNIKIDGNESFSELLKQMLQGGRILKPATSNNIVVCTASDAALINYDMVIISELNENSYPKSYVSSPWLNLQMQKELGLDSKISDLGHTLYEFYLNINNKQVLLTRSKKSSGVQTLISPFILHLKYILGDKLTQKNALIEHENSYKTDNELIAAGESFPKQISATDIEALIRAPYNFYAKKILNLKNIDEINDQPSLADFGNFFHVVAEEYSNHFPNKNIDEISNKYLETIDVPAYNKNSWKTKIMAIAPDFIEFEKERRKKIKSVHCEIKGTLELDIKGQKVTILAIADRIEINHDGSANIMDYKTGAIPTKKDVLSGLSPQMIIESIILSENGFNIPTHKTSKLVYVKINSQKPYIKNTEIELSEEDIQNHKQGLISLLEHYVITNQYPIEPCTMKYDNYKHLARRL